MSKRNYVWLLVTALLFSVFVSGGCDLGQSDNEYPITEEQHDDGDAPTGYDGSYDVDEFKRYEGHGKVPDNWTDLTGTWQPASGIMIYFDASGKEITEYKLIPNSSENFAVTVTGSGSPYTVEQGDITLYYREIARSSEEEDNVVGFVVKRAGSTSEMTVSGSKLSNSSVSIEENIDKDTFVFTFEETISSGETIDGNVVAKKIERVLVQRVINAEKTPLDWTSLTGTWKPVSGNLTYDDVLGNEVEQHELLADESDSFEVAVTKSGSSYYLNSNEGTLYFEGDNSRTHNTEYVIGNDGNGLLFKISGGKAIYYSDSHDQLYKLRSFEYVDDEHVIFVAELLYDENDEELLDRHSSGYFPEKTVKRTEVISFERVNQQIIFQRKNLGIKKNPDREVKFAIGILFVCEKLRERL